MSLPMTNESSLLLSPALKQKYEDRRNTSHVWQHMKKSLDHKKIVCSFENCSKVYTESTSTRVALSRNHLKVEHKINKLSLEESDSEFENTISPKVIRLSD